MSGSRHIHGRALQVCGLLACLAAGPAAGGDWQFAPRVSLSEVASDNVTLAPRDELADLITTIEPGVTVRGTSARVTSNVDYNLQYLDYLDNAQFDDLSHQLESSTEFVLLEDRLFFGSSARMSQQNASSRGTFSQSNRAQTGNRTDVLYYEYGPQFRHAFGRWATLNASYTMNTVERTAAQGGGQGGGQGAGGSDEDVIEVALQSGTRVPRVPLGLSYSSRDLTQNNGRESKLERLTADIGYRINRQFELNAQGGVDSNEFTTNRSSQDGPFWNVGAKWRPTTRTDISGRYGDRFFGRNFNVRASHRMRRLALSFSYNEDVRTTNQIQSDLRLVPLEDAFGNPVFDPTLAADITSPLEITSLRDDITINKRMEMSIFYAGRRRDFRFRFFENENEFQSTGDAETSRGVSLHFTHQLTRLTTFTLTGLWRENEPRSGGSSNRNISISPALRFSLGRHMFVNVNYEFSDGSGGTGNASEFTENALTADVSYVF